MNFKIGSLRLSWLLQFIETLKQHFHLYELQFMLELSKFCINDVFMWLPQSSMKMVLDWVSRFRIAPSNAYLLINSTYLPMRYLM